MDLYEVLLSVSLLCFGIGTMLDNFYMFKHTREECVSNRA